MEPNQYLQIPGAILILTAYVLLQAGRLSAHSRRFSAMNALGAGLLAAEAIHTEQWGFLLLEGTWTLVSLIAMFKPQPNNT